MPKEIATNSQAVNNEPLHYAASPNTLAATAVPVSSVSNSALLPAIETPPFLPMSNSLPLTSRPVDSAMLLPFNSSSRLPDIWQDGASSTSQPYSIPSTNMQPRLTVPGTAESGNFHSRMQKAIENKQIKRPQGNLEIISRAGTILARTLLDIQLTPPKNDKPEASSSSSDVTPPAMASISDSSKTLSRRQYRQPAAFTSFFYTGMNTLTSDNYQALKLKAQRFVNFFPENTNQIVVHLCQKWKTTDIESVMTLYEILREKYPAAEIESLATDEVFFHCFVNKELLDVGRPQLTNIKYQLQDTDKRISVEYYHGSALREELKDISFFAPRYHYASEFKEGGIAFSICVKDAPIENNESDDSSNVNADRIEVRCTLANLLLNKAEIGRIINTRSKSMAFIRCKSPPIDCEIVERITNNTAN